MNSLHTFLARLGFFYIVRKMRLMRVHGPIRVIHIARRDFASIRVFAMTLM